MQGRRMILAAAMLALAGCAAQAGGEVVVQQVLAEPAPAAGPRIEVGARREAALLARDGARIGQVLLQQGPAGVLLTLELSPKALPPGWHGLHIHERGDCADAAAGFKASGAHAGHGETAQHGLLNPAGPEAGDLPNLFVPETEGPMAAEFYTTAFALSAPPAAGAALIIHENRDDHASQPIGAAGARLACAVLAPPQS